jgi:hypothetical protein
MRTIAAALVITVGATWSLAANAQLQPPPPMQPRQETPQWPAPPPPPGQSQWAPPSQQSGTVQQLNAGDNASSFRRFEIVYTNLEVGGGYVNIGDKFSNQASQGGAVIGLGAGVRLLVFTLGLRGRVAPLSSYLLIEVNAEAGVHLPIGAWDPYLNVHGGYAHASMNSQPLILTLGGASIDFGSVTPPSPSGGDFGGSVGTDYYFSSLFSLGVDATLDALFLSTGDTSLATVGKQTIKIQGQSNTGVAFFGSVHAGLHFDL